MVLQFICSSCYVFRSVRLQEIQNVTGPPFYTQTTRCSIRITECCCVAWAGGCCSIPGVLLLAATWFDAMVLLLAVTWCAAMVLLLAALGGSILKLLDAAFELPSSITECCCVALAGGCCSMPGVLLLAATWCDAMVLLLAATWGGFTNPLMSLIRFSSAPSLRIRAGEALCELAH
jgi:hypothetical protein